MKAFNFYALCWFLPVVFRWKKSLNPLRVRVGKWDQDEDKRLKISVRLFGAKNWNKIAKFVSGRTQVQCRERYYYTHTYTHYRWKTGQAGLGNGWNGQFFLSVKTTGLIGLTQMTFCSKFCNLFLKTIVMWNVIIKFNIFSVIN